MPSHLFVTPTVWFYLSFSINILHFVLNSDVITRMRCKRCYYHTYLPRVICRPQERQRFFWSSRVLHGNLFPTNWIISAVVWNIPTKQYDNTTLAHILHELQPSLLCDATTNGFCVVNNAQFCRFPISKFSWHLNTTTSIGEVLKTFGTEFKKFYRNGSFFQNSKNSSTNVNVLRLHAL